MRAALKRLAATRLIRFVKGIPEVFFAVFLLCVVLAVIYRFEKPEGVIHDQLPGVFFDIAVFGVLIVIFNKLVERRREIKRYREEIEDYLPWKEPEATYRITGIIKRLNRLGVSDINLKGATLNHAILENVNLQGADLTWANLPEAHLREAKLQGASLAEADLQGANLKLAQLQRGHLKGALLQEAHLEGANLQEADLQGAYFQRASLGEANLQEANLREVNLQGVMGITLEQISKVKTLYEVQNLDPELMIQIQEKYPHLLEEPKE
jgi:hypothetical protein